MRRALAAAALILIAGAVQAADWRRIATPPDRSRLRGWRDAWVTALEQARRVPDGAAAIAADPMLYDPDHALVDPMPPAGEYRCRAVKLGGRSTPGFVPYAWFGCRVGAGADAVPLMKTTGSQRPAGLLYADTDARAVFLGTLSLGDEARPMPYGRDRSRDMAGIVERIGERRWRLVLPYPAFESTLDIIELVPAD